MSALCYRAAVFPTFSLLHTLNPHEWIWVFIHYDIQNHLCTNNNWLKGKSHTQLQDFTCTLFFSLDSWKLLPLWFSCSICTSVSVCPVDPIFLSPPGLSSSHPSVDVSHCVSVCVCPDQSAMTWISAAARGQSCAMVFPKMMEARVTRISGYHSEQSKRPAPTRT